MQVLRKGLVFLLLISFFCIIYVNFKDKFLFEYRLKKNWFLQIPAELTPTKYLSVVVLSKQRNYIFVDKKFFKSYLVSTGSKDRYPEDRTLRQGVWKLAKRVSQNLEPLYGPRLIYLNYYNPSSKKFFATRKAFHGTDEPQNLGKPTSMGCVYHHNDDIMELYDLLPENTLVITTEK